MKRYFVISFTLVLVAIQIISTRQVLAEFSSLPNNKVSETTISRVPFLHNYLTKTGYLHKHDDNQVTVSTASNELSANNDNGTPQTESTQNAESTADMPTSSNNSTTIKTNGSTTQTSDSSPKSNNYCLMNKITVSPFAMMLTFGKTTTISLNAYKPISDVKWSGEGLFTNQTSSSSSAQTIWQSNVNSTQDYKLTASYLQEGYNCSTSTTVHTAGISYYSSRYDHAQVYARESDIGMALKFILLDASGSPVSIESFGGSKNDRLLYLSFVDRSTGSNKILSYSYNQVGNLGNNSFEIDIPIGQFIEFGPIFGLAPNININNTAFLIKPGITINFDFLGSTYQLIK